MPQLRNISYRVCIKKIKKLGFSFSRDAKGSHEIWYSAQRNTYIVVAKHANRDMKIGTLRAMLRQGNIELEEFLRA